MKSFEYETELVKFHNENIQIDPLAVQKINKMKVAWGTFVF